jgi:hypothetical protein
VVGVADDVATVLPRIATETDMPIDDQAGTLFGLGQRQAGEAT